MLVRNMLSNLISQIIIFINVEYVEINFIILIKLQYVTNYLRYVYNEPNVENRRSMAAN